MAAGQRPITAQEAPDHQQILSFTLKATIARYTPLFIAERDIIVEEVRVRAEAVDGTTAGLTGNLAYAASGVALSTNTDITDTVALGTGDSANNTVVLIPTLDSATTYGVPSANIVPGDSRSSAGVVTKGSTVLWEFSAAPDSALTPMTVTVRISTKKQ